MGAAALGFIYGIFAKGKRSYWIKFSPRNA
jgi:hypothetical protein